MSADRMRPWVRAAAASIPLLCGLSLSGCSSLPAAPRVIRISLPDGLTRCQDEPPAPAQPENDGVFLDWVTDALAAGRDCRSRLRTVDEIVNTADQR